MRFVGSTVQQLPDWVLSSMQLERLTMYSAIITTELQRHLTVWNWKLFAELSSVQFSCTPMRVDELH
jgi:hypothetical protein